MPTSPRPYKDTYRKNAATDNQFLKPKDMVRHQDLEGERRKNMKRWIHFFRKNPHRFIETYFGLVLYPYQILMIWALQRSDLAYIVAARASAKSFIIAVWALALAILYPGIQVVICAKTLKQGGIIISEKAQYVINVCPNVAREVQSITHNYNNYEITFHCGSTIKVVPSSESARGNRANYIIVEESRLVDKTILESVIKPFLFSRMPPYRLREPYASDKRLQEEGNISFISSAYYRTEYWYSYVKSCIRRVAAGDTSATFLAFDYLITIRHNIKTAKMIRNEMEDSEPITVEMEYLNIPSGSSGKSYFKMSMFGRTIKKAFYPQRDDSYDKKKNPYDLPKTDGEIRVMSVDVATRANKENDLSIMACARLIPMIGKGYIRELVYMESHKGINTLTQAKRIKEIYHDFGCNYLIIDLQQAGIGIFDGLSQITSCEERGIDFPAMTVAEFDFIDGKLYDELTKRTLGAAPLSVIYPILATQPLNSQIAVAMRSSLQNKLWKFMVEDARGEEFLLQYNKEFRDDTELYGFFMNPYIQTGLFIGECINLDMTLVSGFIRLVERAGLYKDRYSCISYMNWFVSFLDKELLKSRDSSSDWDTLKAITML